MLLRNFINSIIPDPYQGKVIHLRTTGDTYSSLRPGCFGSSLGGRGKGSQPYSVYHIGRTGTSGSTDYRDAIAIAIGKGTTPPTFEDYLIEDPITSGLTSISSSNNVGGNDEYRLSNSVVFSETLFNGGSTDVEISEIGLLSTAGSSQYGCDLLTRDVLTTPIIIKPQEAKTITVNIDFTQMSTNVSAS